MSGPEITHSRAFSESNQVTGIVDKPDTRTSRILSGRLKQARLRTHASSREESSFDVSLPLLSPRILSVTLPPSCTS